MSARDAMRAAMDEMMGRDRDLEDEEKQKRAASRHFSDAENCPHFLEAFCPHQLFASTKSDIGTCKQRHDQVMKDQYQAEPEHRRERYGYKRNLVQKLQNICSGVNRRISAIAERLTKPDPVVAEAAAAVTAAAKKRVQDIADAIAAKIVLAEKAGEEGEVDKCQELVDEVSGGRAGAGGDV
jgi:RNA-binding protein Luc7-like 2